MKRYLSCYTHIDGTRWTGPEYYADSFDEAQALAMEYPVQPITIIGEHVETALKMDGDIELQYRRTPMGMMH